MGPLLYTVTGLQRAHLNFNEMKNICDLQSDTPHRPQVQTLKLKKLNIIVNILLKQCFNLNRKLINLI